MSRGTSTGCARREVLSVVQRMVAGTAGAARTFGNQARTAPKLPTALTSTIAAISCHVDPKADITDNAATWPGRSSAGAIDRVLLCGVHAPPDHMFAHKHGLESILAYSR